MMETRCCIEHNKPLDETGFCEECDSFPADIRIEKVKAVLVVDDDTANRQLMSDAMRRLGFQTVTANDGVEGLHLFRTFYDEAFDLVLSDFQMPRMNGVDMVSRIRHLEPTQRVLMMSAEPMTVRKQLTTKGYSDVRVLFKPFSMAELKEEVERLM